MEKEMAIPIITFKDSVMNERLVSEISKGKLKDVDIKSISKVYMNDLPFAWHIIFTTK